MNSVVQLTAWRLVQVSLMAAVAQSPLLGQKDIPWYVEQFVRAEFTSQVQRAHAIFDRLSAAADRSGSRYPEFAVLEGGDDPLAVALQGGGIVVNLRALQICYKAESLEKGHDRLAFVLAHELSHLVIGSFGAKFASADALGQPDVEDEADSHGLLIMTMAGFRPESILEGGQTLFQDWLAARTPGLPDVADSRAKAFQKQLQSLSEKLPLFQMGVVLYSLGRYREALRLFGKFRQSFPSREAFHNQALSQFQIALRILARCDGAWVVRYSLPVQADPWTLAQRSRPRGPSADCLQSPQFDRAMKRAEELLQEALRRDSGYLSARIHLATLYVVNDRIHEAWSEAKKALDLEPGNPFAVNTQAVSGFLFGEEASRADFKQDARTMLQGLLRKHPDFLPARFNLARMESLSGNPGSAKGHWKAYLKDAPSEDEMAKAAAEQLGIELPDSKKPSARTHQSPLPLGIPDPALQAKLRRLNLLHRSGPVEIYGSDQMRVIRIGGSIEVVEVRVNPETDKSSFKGLAMIQATSPSLEIRLEGQGQALKVIGNRVQSRIFFRPPQP